MRVGQASRGEGLIQLNACDQRAANGAQECSDQNEKYAWHAHQVDLLVRIQTTISRVDAEGQCVVNTLADQRIIQALDLLREVLASNLQSQAALAESVSESAQ